MSSSALTIAGHHSRLFRPDARTCDVRGIVRWSIRRCSEQSNDSGSQVWPEMTTAGVRATVTPPPH
jgi:hypothetical protein